MFDSLFSKIIFCVIAIYFCATIFHSLKNKISKFNRRAKTKINKIKVFFERHFKDQGTAGEKVVSKILRRLPKEEYRVFNNILLETKSGTTQIDHLVISQYGIFVIETKNYKGVISSRNNSRDWYQCINNREETPISNPVIQNSRHIKHLATLLKIQDHTLLKSIVTFSRLANVIAKSDDSDLCYYDELINNIEKYYVKTISSEDCDRYCSFIEENNIMSAKNMRQHVERAKVFETKIKTP